MWVTKAGISIKLILMPKSIKALYQKYERWVPILFFLLGFIFDASVLNRIDELHVIIQQAIYLAISAALIRFELLEGVREVRVPKILERFWKYREALLHFLLGTLLNCYTIFYFKSASAFTSFVFIILLIALLVVNEFKRFGESQTKVHVAFLALCLVSYCSSLIPIILGSIGTLPFLLSAFVAGSVFYFYTRWLKADLGENCEKMKTHLYRPYFSVHSLFAVLYFAHAIPPVPLSVEYMGIYHDVKRGAEGYILSSTRPAWKFWEHGDQTFLARPGDVVYCFAQIFSPSRFSDKLQVRWSLYDEKRGWVKQDAIPLPILGGREEGYRTFTRKENYTPGEWRVQIETLEGHEVGRIGFKIVEDINTDLRSFQNEVR